jgi:energy-coupling factor transport system substrate-specific component
MWYSDQLYIGYGKERLSMKELITMWKNTRMIVLVALTAAVYAAILIPFKVALPIVPGFTEVRPANVIPIIFSLMFGPAAAWGSAFGNLIADAFGTWGPGSLFGFVGNFLMGFIPYKIWQAFGKGEPIAESRRSTGKSILIALAVGVIVALMVGLIARFTEFTNKPMIYVPVISVVALICAFLVLRFLSIRYFTIMFSASAACGVFIGWGVHILGLVPFPALGNIIVLNNLVVSAVLGPLLLPVLYPAVKRMGLLYTDVMEEAELSKSRAWASALIVVVITVSLIVGNWVAIGGYGSGVLGSAMARTEIFTNKLFSIDLEMQGDLDSQKASEELLQAFQNSDITLSDKTIVITESEGSQWLVIDNKWRIIRSKPEYSVRKTEDKLAVYGRNIKGRYGVGLSLLPLILLMLIAAAIM